MASALPTVAGARLTFRLSPDYFYAWERRRCLVCFHFTHLKNNNSSLKNSIYVFERGGRLLVGVVQSLALFAICIIQARGAERERERAGSKYLLGGMNFTACCSRSEQCKFIICWFLIALSEGFAFAV